MDDLISRQAAIDAVIEITYDQTALHNGWVNPYYVVNRLEYLPTADLSEYCDKLWKTAYERGKAEAHLKKGKWIVHKSPDEYHCGMVECPFCGEELIAEPNEYCFCPNCGARMEE